MAEVQWYYARNNKQFGPVSAAELRQLAEAGRLSPDDLLWREGMDAWATAINLRGLFSDDAQAGSSKLGTPAIVPGGASGSQPMMPPTQNPRAVPPAAAPAALQFLLRATPIVLWTICVLVVLAGMILFTRAFLSAKDAAQETAAAAVCATFFIAAYVLARCGEKLTRLLSAHARRRSR